MQHLKADYSLIKKLDTFRYDHLLSDHPFFKKKYFSFWKVTFFWKRLSESEARAFMCSFLTKLSVNVTAHCYKLFLITATNYSCRMQRKKCPDGTKKKSTLLLSRTHEPNLQANPSCSLFISLEGELLKDLVLMHLIEQISLQAWQAEQKHINYNLGETMINV